MNAKILTVIVIFVLAGSVAGILLVGDNEVAAEGDFTIVDDRGVEFKFDSPFTKIASLGKPFTQIFYELGAGDKIVSIDTYSKDLNVTFSDIDNKTWVGGSIFGLDPQMVLLDNPDVVITYAYTSSSVTTRIAAMEALGLKVLAFYPKSYNNVISLIENLGMIAGETVKATELANQMIDVRNEVALKIASAETSPKVYFELMSYSESTVNIGSVSHSLIVMAGGTNVAQDATKGTTYKPDPETVISWNSSIIIVEDLNSKTNQQILDLYNPAGNNVSVHRFTTGYNTYDLNLMRGLMEIAEYIHPEIDFDFS